MKVFYNSYAPEAVYAIIRDAMPEGHELVTLDKDSDAGKILAKPEVTPQHLNAAIEQLRKGRTAESTWAANA